MKLGILLEKLGEVVKNHFVDDDGYINIHVSHLGWAEVGLIKESILWINPINEDEIELVFDSTITAD